MSGEYTFLKRPVMMIPVLIIGPPCGDMSAVVRLGDRPATCSTAPTGYAAVHIPRSWDGLVRTIRT